MSQIANAETEYRADSLKYLTELVARRDWGEAIRFFESSSNLWQSQADLQSGVMMRLGAKAYGSSENFTKALPLIRTAISIVAQFAGETGKLGECYITLGDILRDMGNLGDAEKAYRDAESIFRRNDDISHTGDALNMLAGILFRKGDLNGSLQYLLDSVEAARKEGENRKLAYLFGNIGRVYTMLGRLSSAEENIRLNVGLSEEFEDEKERIRAYLSLGFVHMQQGRYDTALDDLKQAREVIRDNKYPREKATYLMYAGELAMKMGDYNDAEDLLNKAAEREKKPSLDSVDLARPFRLLAELAIIRGNYRKAMQLANDAMLTVTKLNDALEIGALRRILAVCLEKLEKAEDARSSFAASVEILEEHKIKIELAETLVAMGNSQLYDPGRKMIHLFRAEEIYQHCGNLIRVCEIQKLIGYIEPAKKQESPAAKSSVSEPDGFQTRNPRMLRILSQMSLLKRSDLPILITGETGTGKDHLARYFHSITRPDGPYVAVNCAAVPESLVESEYFGYHKGAFTGADMNTPGKFQAANHGVLLLDEIGELPLPLQAKLLNIMDDKKIRPLGTSSEIELDLIIIAATNRDLFEMVNAGTFRKDLYYRLAGFSFELPPLRERKEDIPYLLQYFMRKNGLLEPNEKPSPELVRYFVGHNWPGNIRELEHEVKRISTLKGMAEEGHLDELARGSFDNKREEETNSFYRRMERFEKQILVEALAIASGNKSRAARSLDIHESTLRQKVKRHSLEAMVN